MELLILGHEVGHRSTIDGQILAVWGQGLLDWQVQHQYKSGSDKMWSWILWLWLFLSDCSDLDCWWCSFLASLACLSHTAMCSLVIISKWLILAKIRLFYQNPYIQSREMADAHHHMPGSTAWVGGHNRPWPTLSSVSPLHYLWQYIGPRNTAVVEMADKDLEVFNHFGILDCYWVKVLWAWSNELSRATMLFQAKIQGDSPE